MVITNGSALKEALRHDYRTGKGPGRWPEEAEISGSLRDFSKSERQKPGHYCHQSLFISSGVGG